LSDSRNSRKELVCVYCLLADHPLTVDHVFPKSWYPNGGIPDLEKWTVPCCKGCNTRYSRIEKRILEKIGLCLSPTDPLVGDIAQKAVRAAKPSAGRNQEDSAHRAKRLEALRKDIKYIGREQIRGILPFFGPTQGDEGTLATVTISEEDLKCIGAKFVRGMLFVNGGYLLGGDYRIECYINTEQSDVDYFKPLYYSYGKRYELSPGLVAIMILSQDPPISLYRFEIWQRLIIHGSVVDKDGQ